MYLSQDYKIKPEHEVVFPYHSESLLYGAGLYETLKTIKQKPIALNLHLDRLAKSLNSLNIDYPLSEQKISEQISDLIKAKNTKQEQRIRINIFLNKKPTLIIDCQDLKTTTPNNIISKTLDSTRILPLHKTTSMMEQFLLKSLPSDNYHHFEYIYTNQQKLLTEGLKTDIIYRYQNHLFTTTGAKLPSITLKILESALQTKITARKLKLSELNNQEITDIYLINSIIDIVRIDQLNSRVFAKQNEATKELQQIYLTYLQTTYG